jgi:hypothetical protein
VDDVNLIGDDIRTMKTNADVVTKRKGILYWRMEIMIGM